MTLKEKFLQIKDSQSRDGVTLMFENEAKECEQIADDYAIEFAYWLIHQDICQRGEKNFVCADGRQRNTQELLETFKKEKGL